MFRAAQSTEPVNSRYLQEKWDATTYTMHRQRVRAARPTVDTTQPSLHPHVRSKARKRQLDETRFAQIEKDNRKLLEHMTHIMKRKGRIDHHNDYYHKSTNSCKRQRELDRIAQENEKMLGRIASLQPVYSTVKWAAESKEHQQQLFISSRYSRNRRTQLPALNRTPARERRGLSSSLEPHFTSHSRTSYTSDNEHRLITTKPLPYIGETPEEPEETDRD
ncbi:sperm axonemal maintenance protein CFAP97D1-like isoform X2 [Corticium candelabrum]|uniref:sperm axonemal maintenance protein CFAP97D1-like isoform X2 n=1 Tax=Corticium candelabrum TaxID=121492 RepID=UPI002E26E31E|nr:sperm axonemal maintenance protein CFAP97D1-like isoform X2 [Corticium candelabrum]